MENPNIEVKVVHSQSKSAWNIIGTKLGGKYKIARIPYQFAGDEELNTRYRLEAFNHAEFIAYCFNNADHVCNPVPAGSVILRPYSVKYRADQNGYLYIEDPDGFIKEKNAPPVTDK
jgi:hypothetical protein